MTITYPHDRPLPPEPPVEAAHSEPFVPVYARTRTTRRKGGIKTWMILAPVAVLVLGGVGVAMVAGGGDETPATPLAEPAATAPVLPAQPLVNERTATVTVTAEPVVDATPTPVPVRRVAPVAVRRSAPARAPAAPASEAPPAAPAEPTGPQPYTAALNAEPTPAPTTPPPVIVIQPAD